MAEVAPLDGGEWELNACSLTESYINSNNNQVFMVVRGREPKGRLEVDIVKTDKLSLNHILVNSGNAKLVPVSNSSHEFQLEKYERFLSESAAEKISQDDSNLNPGNIMQNSGKIARSELDAFLCSPTHVVDPDTIYVIKFEDLVEFEQILTGVQNCQTRLVGPKPGVLCLAQNDGLWYRARILDLSPDNLHANIFFLDVGTSVTKPTFGLMKLDDEFCGREILHRVGLHGIQPASGSKWSSEVIEKLTTVLLDPENERGFYCIVKDAALVDLVDTKGNSVREQILEGGWARIKGNYPKDDELSGNVFLIHFRCHLMAEL